MDLQHGMCHCPVYLGAVVLCAVRVHSMRERANVRQGVNSLTGFLKGSVLSEVGFHFDRVPRQEGGLFHPKLDKACHRTRQSACV